MKVNEASVTRMRLAGIAAAMLSAATVALSGCYLFSPSQGSENKLQTQLHFDITQCQQTAPNLYKCPSVDKSICGAFYAGSRSIASPWTKTAT